MGVIDSETFTWLGDSSAYSASSTLFLQNDVVLLKSHIEASLDMLPAGFFLLARRTAPLLAPASEDATATVAFNQLLSPLTFTLIDADEVLYSG